jgi:AraC-like DNA-binding protein
VAASYSRYFAVSNTDRAWGLYVTGVGHATVSPEDSYPPTPHPAAYFFEWERGRVLEEFALLHIAKGQGIFDSRTVRELSLSAGDVVVICPNQWHRYRPDPGTGWEEFWITFGGDMADHWRRRDLLTPKSPRVAGNMHFVLEALFEQILESSRQTLPAPLFMAGLCHSILGCALSSSNLVERNTRERQLYAAAAYIHNHPHKTDLDWLAKHVGMSPSTFRRHFRACFGSAPVEYCAQQRLSMAKRYLTETAWPLKEIASQLGYSSEFYFMQVFKRRTGLTPTQWRCREQNRRSG